MEVIIYLFIVIVGVLFILGLERWDGDSSDHDDES